MLRIEFKDIPNFGNRYSINKDGQILNKETGSLVSTYIGIDNYEHCVLFAKGKRYRKRVHRIMGSVFLGNPQVVAHKNNNKSDNRLQNLERSTHKQNIKKAYLTGCYQNTHKVKLTAINKDGTVLICQSMRDAERRTGVDRHRIKTFLQETRNNHTDWTFKLN